MKRVHRYLTLLVMLVFFVETMPDELIHLFAHHHDTIDSHSSVTAVSTQHIHCAALQFSLPVFPETAALRITHPAVVTMQLHFGVLLPVSHVSPVDPSGRAPPVLT